MQMLQIFIFNKLRMSHKISSNATKYKHIYSTWSPPVSVNIHNIKHTGNILTFNNTAFLQVNTYTSYSNSIFL